MIQTNLFRLIVAAAITNRSGDEKIESEIFNGADRGSALEAGHTFF